MLSLKYLFKYIIYTIFIIVYILFNRKTNFYYPKYSEIKVRIIKNK